MIPHGIGLWRKSAERYRMKKSAILCFGAMARELRDILRIPEAEEMAEELSAYIENLYIEW